MLRPFFSYFGGKWRVAPKYPAPECDTIIEPRPGQLLVCENVGASWLPFEPFLSRLP